MHVTVYTTPGCQACRVTKRHLDRHGIDHTERDLTQDDDALTFIRDTLGHQVAPVVVIHHDDGELEHWSGYRPDRIDHLAHTQAEFQPAPDAPGTSSLATTSPSL